MKKEIDQLNEYGFPIGVKATETVEKVEEMRKDLTNQVRLQMALAAEGNTADTTRHEHTGPAFV